MPVITLNLLVHSMYYRTSFSILVFYFSNIPVIYIFLMAEMMVRRLSVWCQRRMPLFCITFPLPTSLSVVSWRKIGQNTKMLCLVHTTIKKCKYWMDAFKRCGPKPGNKWYLQKIFTLQFIVNLYLLRISLYYMWLSV